MYYVSGSASIISARRSKSTRTTSESISGRHRANSARFTKNAGVPYDVPSIALSSDNAILRTASKVNLLRLELRPPPRVHIVQDGFLPRGFGMLHQVIAGLEIEAGPRVAIGG